MNFDFKMFNPVINIDYLVLNCSGNWSNFDNLNTSTLRLELQDVGTKVFKRRYFLISENQKVATILCQPHSKAIKQDLIQVQISNHYFYTYSLFTLKRLVELYIIKFLNLSLNSISRLDISIDFDNRNNIVEQLAHLIQNNRVLLAGRDKAFTPYYVFNQGKSTLTGLTIGKRSSSRFLRVYNKSLEMQQNPKEYIINRWKKNGLSPTNVWRCEYELTSQFFINKQIDNHTINTQIFNTKALIQLFQEAERNHFEIKTNTNKSELNKEKTIPFFEWTMLLNSCNDDNDKLVNISKIQKIIEPSLLVQKRVLKASIREYYISKQQHQNIFLIQYIIEKYHLHDYLDTKINFYIDEFEKLQKAPFQFDLNLFYEHLSIVYENSI